MLAKIPLCLALILSLLFVTQAQSLTLPVEMKPGGMCAGMHCTQGCCTNLACCRTVEQQKSPQPPTPASRSTHIQLATVGLRVVTLLFIPPARERPLAILDEVWTAHTLPPLAVNCIRLI